MSGTSGTTWTRPAYFTVPLADPIRRPFGDSDRAAGLWAELTLEGTLREQLHVGTGIPELVEDRLAAGMTTAPTPASGATSSGTSMRPVVPGSSVKGALRAVFEAVTASCDPLERGQCRPPRRDDNDRRMQLCPACSLFGMNGLRGALAISDLRITGDLAVASIPQRHTGKPTRGRRLYGPEPEVSEATDEELLQVVRPGARLSGTLTVTGAEPWQVGMLLTIAGIVPRGLPHLRLGGGKPQGLGVVELDVTAGTYADDAATWLLGQRQPTTPDVLARWAETAPPVADMIRREQLDRVREVYARYDQHRG